MNETGTAFEGRWFDQDGKPAGRWHGARKRGATEVILRLFLVHWLVPRRVAPPSWIEEVWSGESFHPCHVIIQSVLTDPRFSK
jgi:hypothetical protein